MYKEFLNRELNPDICLDPVSLSGYSDGDLRSYYGDTFLLRKTPEGEWRVVYVRNYCEGSFVVYEFPEQHDYMCPASELYRFMVPQGLYATSSEKFLNYRYLCRKTYKKGFVLQFCKWDSGLDGIRCLHLILFPNPPTDKIFNIGRRILVIEGKVYTAYKKLSIGSFSNGTVDTPFPCVKERFNAYKCPV